MKELFKAVVILIVVVFCFGWGLNIVKLTKCDFNVPAKAEIIRVIGIPVPIIGAIVGYMDIDDTPKKEN